MLFLYETHLHTSQGSRCGHSRGRDYVKAYQDLGYAGIFITDHFNCASCAADEWLRWDRYVDQYRRGFEDAREEGARRGLDVFFGWETTFANDDYLVYGLDADWLKGHPEAANWSRKGQFEAVHAAGGCVVQAHPFRQHGYIRGIDLSPFLVHGVEVANAGNEYDSYDALAARYAAALGLTATAGSDIHRVHDVTADIVFGVRLDRKIASAGEYAAAVRNNALAGLKIPQGRCDFHGTEKINLPLRIRDGNDKVTGNDIWGLLKT